MPGRARRLQGQEGQAGIRKVRLRARTRFCFCLPVFFFSCCCSYWCWCWLWWCWCHLCCFCCSTLSFFSHLLVYLCFPSLQGRPIDVLTVTNPPDRPFKRDNATPLVDRANYVITCRVHPGETSASWTLRGILQCLTQDNPVSNELCDHAVIHIVPCLNPDGVVAGDYRRNRDGVDLNRCYASPVSAEVAPTVLALRMYLAAINGRAADHKARQQRDGPSAALPPAVVGHALTPVQLFLDLHGISSDRGVMTYAFYKSTMSRDERLAVRALPCLMAGHIRSFSFKTSGFYCASEYRKTGVGALTVSTDFDVPHSYTVETSMCGPEPMGAHYDTGAYMQVGHDIVGALLDYASVMITSGVAGLAAVSQGGSKVPGMSRTNMCYVGRGRRVAASRPCCRSGSTPFSRCHLTPILRAATWPTRCASGPPSTS